MINTVNAKIKSTHLGYEDHGVFTAYLMLEWEGSGQGFGGYFLDRYDDKRDKRFGTEKGMTFIMRVVDAVGVSAWEELKGKYVRIKQDHNKIYGIGHITKSQWFMPEEEIFK